MVRGENLKEIERRVPQSDGLFLYIETKEEGSSIAFGCVSGQYILSFVLKGEIILENKRYGLSRAISGRHFFLIPDDEGWEGCFSSGTELILLSFEKADLSHLWRDLVPLQNLIPADGWSVPVALPFCSSVYLLINLLSVYMREQADDLNLYLFKDRELLELIILSYSQEELAALFYPVLTSENEYPGKQCI